MNPIYIPQKLASGIVIRLHYLYLMHLLKTTAKGPSEQLTASHRSMRFSGNTIATLESIRNEVKHGSKPDVLFVELYLFKRHFSPFAHTLGTIMFKNGYRLIILKPVRDTLKNRLFMRIEFMFAREGGLVEKSLFREVDI